jgi:hypothetical protein
LNNIISENTLFSNVIITDAKGLEYIFLGYTVKPSMVAPTLAWGPSRTENQYYSTFILPLNSKFL